MVTCHIDGNEYETVAEIHALLKGLRIKQASYYTQFYPRACKGSGEPIPYKDYKQYFSQEFKDKNALKAWFKKDPVAAKVWAIDWLRKRKEEKGLIYAPSQAELRSLQCPIMSYYDSVGGYHNICRELGFKDRYIGQSIRLTSDLSDATVIQDSREQAPLKLPLKTIVEKVEVGDYALAAPHDKGTRVERKSISDFAGTLNCRKVTRKKSEDSSFERFTRELDRAVGGNLYVVMLVETALTQALSFDYLPQMKWSKVAPSHVFKNLRDLLTKYPLHFQVVFADGRVEAARIAVKLFQMGDQVRQIDLQQALEKGDL